MRRSKLIATTTALALAASGGLALTGTAIAGHENDLLEATLDGRSEVATGATSNRIVGDPNGRGEAYVFGIDDDVATLCYVLTVEKIADLELGVGAPRAAHIHEGQPGENGPVVANLAWPQSGNAADCLTDGEAGKFPVQKDGSTVTAAEILETPGNYYVNVHNSEYPGGAVRGQLAPQE